MPDGLRRGVAATLALGLIVAFPACGGDDGGCKGFRWDRAAWQARDAKQPLDGESRRQELLETLLECDGLDGKSRADVRALLGPPERVGRVDDGALLWEWGLGRRGSIGVGTEYLHVVFRRGRVDDVERV